MSKVIIRPIEGAPMVRSAREFAGPNMEDDSTKVLLGEYREKSFLPKSTQKFKPRYSVSDRVYPYDKEYLPEKIFKEEVVKAGLFDSQGRPITTSNLNSEHDPLATHDELILVLDAGHAVLDDVHPIDRIKAAFFMADKRFKKIGAGEEYNKAYSGMQFFEIGIQEDIERAQENNIDAVMEATEILRKVGRSKMILLCKIWDHKIDEKTSDKTIMNYLFQEINSPLAKFGRDTKAEYFLKFAKMPEQELERWDTFFNAQRYRIISRLEGQWAYKSYKLGRTQLEAVEALSLSVNDKILMEIHDAIVVIQEKNANKMPANKAYQMGVDPEKKNP